MNTTMRNWPNGCSDLEHFHECKRKDIYKDGHCHHEMITVSKIDGQPICPYSDNAIEERSKK